MLRILTSPVDVWYLFVKESGAEPDGVHAAKMRRKQAVQEENAPHAGEQDAACGSVIDMNLKKTLRPFRLRLMLEAGLRAVLTGALFVLPVWLVLAVVRRVLYRQDALTAWMLAAWALAASLLYALRFRPTMQETARRIDAQGQQDRVSTMVEFADSDSALCRLQREDAARRLAALPPGRLRIAVSVPAVCACVCLLALIAAVPHIPEDVIARLPGAQQTESEEAAALRGMIEALRAQVEDSELQESDKASLLAQLDTLLAQMRTGRMDLSALQEIRRTMDGMQETVKELTPRDTYTAAMLEFESLRALGEAIYDGNMDVVTMILDSFGRRLREAEGMDQVNALMDLVYDVNASLAKPLRDNSQETLRQAMMMFAGGLESAAEMVYNGRDNAKMIDTALYTAEQYIREFLGVPEEGERYDPYEQMMKEGGGGSPGAAAPRAQAQIEKPLSPAETEFVYDPRKEVWTGGYTPGAAEADGTLQRIPAPEGGQMEGTVPYGEVYGAYYARYLEQLSGDAIPQALREAAETYFNGI